MANDRKPLKTQKAVGQADERRKSYPIGLYLIAKKLDELMAISAEVMARLMNGSLDFREARKLNLLLGHQLKRIRPRRPKFY